jgi:hypothetical protein
MAIDSDRVHIRLWVRVIVNVHPKSRVRFTVWVGVRVGIIST